MIRKVLIILFSVISILLCITEIPCSADDEIVIGSILPLSGAFSTEGLEMKQGMVLALQEVNAAGGAMGKMMKIVFEDTESNPQKVSNAVQKLIDRENIPLILGGLSTTVNLIAGSITNRKKVVQIAIGPGINKFNEIGSYFFCVVGFIDDLGTELARFASIASEPQTAGFFTLNSSLGSIIQENAEKYLFSRKIEVVAKIPFHSEQTDFSPELSALYNARPEIIFITAFYGQADLILNQATQIGFPQQKSGWYVPYIDWLSNFITQETSEGLVGVTIGVDEELYSDFTEKYEKNFGETPSRTLSAYAYDAVKMVALVLNKANYLNTDKLKKALFEVSRTYCGVSGKKQFNQKGMQVSQLYSSLMFKQGNLVKFKRCPVPPWCKKIIY
jgi:branched-chain amino acid transport system substrate-binding protein